MLHQVTGDILLRKAAAFAGQRRSGGRAGLARAYGRGFEWPLLGEDTGIPLDCDELCARLAARFSREIRSLAVR